MCPGKVREHLNLNSHRFRTYQDIREEIFGYLETTYQVSSTAMDLGAVIRKKGPCWICGGQHLAFECRKGGGKGRGSGAKGSGKFGEGKGRTTRQASLVAKARVVASPEDVVERVLAKASQQRLQRRLTAPFAESWATRRSSVGTSRSLWPALIHNSVLCSLPSPRPPWRCTRTSRAPAASPCPCSLCSPRVLPLVRRQRKPRLHQATQPQQQKQVQQEHLSATCRFVV